MQIFRIIPCLLIIIFGCKPQPVEETIDDNQQPIQDIHYEVTESQLEMTNILFGVPEKALMSRVLDCTGQVEVPPKSIYSLYSPVPGFISSVNQYEGQYVRRGTVLTHIQHPDLVKSQMEFLEKIHRLEFHKSEFDRKKNLFENDATSAKEYEEAKANYEVLKTDIKGQEIRLKQLGFDVERLTSEQQIEETVAIVMPISGYITEIFVNPGKYVSETDLLYKLIDPRHFHLDVEVFTKDISGIKKGDRILAVVPGTEGKIDGEVFLIGKAVHKESNTVHVHGHIDHNELNLVAGTYVQAKIFTDEKEVMTVPIGALVHEGSNTYVFVGDGRIFKKEPVTTGRENADLVEVLDLNLEPGQSIVIEGAYYLNSAGVSN